MSYIHTCNPVLGEQSPNHLFDNRAQMMTAQRIESLDLWKTFKYKLSREKSIENSMWPKANSRNKK